MYKENPKTKNSGILACIPQKGECPLNCSDCFYNSHRSYLQPLEDNTPNMPSLKQSIGRVIRVNDGLDSNIQQDLVIEATKMYQFKFYNTSIPTDLEKFDAPVVLTINPGKMTNVDFYKLDPIPRNLMFVRIRTNTWNIFDVVYPAVNYYTEREVPVVLTFMAYFDTSDKIPEHHRENYIFRKRTLNSYYAITTKAWREVMQEFEDNIYVDSCGKIEGEKGNTKCRFCGNCLKHYFACSEKMRDN